MTYIGKNSALLQKKNGQKTVERLFLSSPTRVNANSTLLTTNNLKMRYDVWEEDFEESVIKKAI